MHKINIILKSRSKTIDSALATLSQKHGAERENKDFEDYYRGPVTLVNSVVIKLKCNRGVENDIGMERS